MELVRTRSSLSLGVVARRWMRLWIGVLGIGLALVGIGIGARRFAAASAKRLIAEAAGATAGAWRYENAEHAFSFALPSSDWQVQPKGEDVARFAAGPHGVALFARVKRVMAHTKAEYEATLVALEKELGTSPRAVGLPLFAKTTAEAGAPVFMATLTLRTGTHTAFIAACRSWLRERGITVDTEFEARPPSWKDDGSMDLSGFEPMARGICLSVQSSVAVATSGASSAKAGLSSAPAVPVGASLRTTKVPPFVFDWSPPCRVPVREKRRVGAHTMDTRYWVHLRKGAADQLLVTVEGLERVAYDGQDTTGPEWRARFDAGTSLAATLPTLELTHDGQFVSSQPMDQAIERVIAERHLSAAEASVLRKKLDVPGEREHLIDDMRGNWKIWVEAWRGFAFRPGERRTRERPEGGWNSHETTQMTMDFVSYAAGYATLRRTTSLKTDAANRFFSSYLNVDPAVPEYARGAPIASGDARITDSVEIRPESLRPRLTRTTTAYDLRLVTSATTTGQNSLDQEWDWDHAEGCTK
jgi:hypothetical protein